MTDIVERLRETETDMYVPPEVTNECREAADEIERLRREVSDLNAGWQRTYDHDCNLMKLEIERLRGLLHEAEKMWPNPGLSTESSQWYRCVREELGKTDEIADYDGVDVEKVRTIPALAAILRKAQGVVDVEDGSPVDVGAECVAIREEHDALRKEIALLYKRREIDEAEIERLRREVSDLNAGWQRTYDHDCNLMKLEIERLRWLLREAMECGCIISASNPNGLPSGAEWPFDLYERVREALGDDR